MLGSGALSSNRGMKCAKGGLVTAQVGRPDTCRRRTTSQPARPNPERTANVGLGGTRSGSRYQGRTAAVGSQETFAVVRGNGRDAPITVLPIRAREWEGSTRPRH